MFLIYCLPFIYFSLLILKEEEEEEEKEAPSNEIIQKLSKSIENVLSEEYLKTDKFLRALVEQGKNGCMFFFFFFFFLFI